MLDYEELVKRLREPCQYENCILCQQAADAIEELIMQQRGNDEAVKVMQMEIDRLLASRTPKREAESKWISVEDRLPEAMPGNYSLDVLVTDGESIAICQYFNGDGWCSMWSYSGIGKITHWMPMPQPPKEENK